MRYGKKQDKQRVIWLVKFLELWCDGKEIEKRILNYVKKSKEGLINKDTHELYGEVYSFFSKINPETKLLLKEAAPEYISKQIQLTNDDFNNLVKKKDYKKILETILKTEVFTNEQKYTIFELIFGNLELLKFVNNRIRQHETSRKDESIIFPYFYLLFMFHVIIIEVVDEKDLDKISKNGYDRLSKEEKELKKKI